MILALKKAWCKVWHQKYWKREKGQYPHLRRNWCARCNCTIYTRLFAKDTHEKYMKVLMEEMKKAAADPKTGLTLADIKRAKAELDACDSWWK